MSDLTLIEYDQLADKNLFFKFCQHASQEISQSAHANMWDIDWQSRPNTLAYQIHNRDRYFDTNGKFHLALDNGVIVACSGVYKGAFSNEVAIGGCRTWISKDYRHRGLLREIFLPVHKKWALDNNCKVIAITFNDYNKNLIEAFKRKRLGEKRLPRQPRHLFYSGLNEIDFPVIIQCTPQWVIYEKLDTHWDFDWSSIRTTSTPDFSKNSTPATSL